MNEEKTDSSKKKSRNYLLIGYAFFLVMAFFWSVDSSIVRIFFGLGCFFMFLAFYSRPATTASREERSYSKSYRPQGQREYTGNTESFEDKVKQIFERKSSPSSGQPNDALAKGRKIALAIGIAFFVLFTIPFVIALFGSNDTAEAQFYYAQGQDYFSSEKYDSAYIAYGRALKLDPEYAEAMVGYGQTLVIRNEKDSALRMYDHALELKPDYAEANYRKGQVWYEQKNYNEAIEMLTPVLIDNPQYYDAMLLMGDCYYAVDNLVDALAWYENAYQNGGIRGSQLCYMMGYLHENIQETQRAIELYKEALDYEGYPDTVKDIYKRLGLLIPGDEGNIYRAKAMEQQN